jgi:hypothetical protein
LIGRVLRDGDDVVRALSSIVGECREARPELGRGIVTAHDEQIVKGRHRAAKARAWQTLIQPVKERNAGAIEKGRGAFEQSARAVRGG